MATVAKVHKNQIKCNYKFKFRSLVLRLKIINSIQPQKQPIFPYRST
jgi:hypothetical protein